MANPIKSGVTSDGIVLINEDITIESGGTVTHLTANNGGRVFLFGYSDSATLNDGGQMSVYGGASADETVVNKGAYLIAGNGGLVSKTRIATGNLYVLEHGSASDTTIGSGGAVNVQAFGFADATTVNPGGVLSIFSGATATQVVENGGTVYISDGANVVFARHTIENLSLSRGSATIHSGTTAANALIAGDGNVNVLDGGLFLSGTVSGTTTAGGLCLNYGGMASALTVSAGGIVYVMDGASVAGLTVQAGGSLSILTGATVTGLLDNGGNVYIADGASVSYAANVISGMVLSTGYYTVRSGTTLTKPVVTRDGNMTVNEGGLFLSGSVSSCTTAGGLCINYGGTASAAAIGPGGLMYVQSGGSAVACALAGGSLTMNQGAIAGGLTMTGGSLTVTADAVLSDAVIKGGTVYYLSGATANGTTLSTAGQLTVCDGAVAHGLTVSSGGTLTIQAGATVTDLKDNGGYVYIQDGANVTFAANVIDGFVLSSGYYYVHSGTTLSNAVVAQDGMIVVSSGGIVDATTVSKCNAAAYKGLYVSQGGKAVNTQVKDGGALYVYSGGSAIGGTVSAGGVCQVRDNGSAGDIVVQPGGSLTVFAGATVTGLLDNGGYVYIEDGANVSFAANVIDSLIVSEGSYNVHSGTTLTKAVVAGDGVINVYEGGVVESAVVNRCNTADYKGLYLFSGGTAHQTTVNAGGMLYVYEQGFASGGVVSAGGQCLVREGGSAADLTIRAGGIMTVSSGAAAYNILEDGGTVNVLDGATVTFAERIISGTVITDGTTTIHDGTVLVDTVIARNGKLNVVAGGRAESTTVNACTADGGLVVYSGGTVTGNIMNSDGFAYIFSGGTAIDNTIANGGSMTIFSGAVMKDVDILSGGKLYMSAGSVLTGRVRIASEGAYLFIDDWGATIDFDISGFDPSGDREVLLDDYERIRPEPKDAPYAPEFTLTVAPDQSIGTYKLAHGLARESVKFPSITVKSTDGEVLGRAVKDKDTFTYNGVEYRFDIKVDIVGANGYLTLFVHIGDGATADSPSIPTVSADVTELTNSCVTVTARFDSSLSTRQYSLDGMNWQTYENGVAMTENGRVYFRGLNGSTPSGIASYTVRNIDNTAPTAPAGLVANVSGRTVTLNWRPSADDYSGVREYLVSFVSDDGRAFTAKTTDTQYVLQDADYASWQWSVQAVDNVGNYSEVSNGDAFVIVDPDAPNPPAPASATRGDRDGNGVSDVMFVWTGNNYAHGYWMNGSSEWWSANSTGVSSEWDNLGSYDMSGDGKADAVMFGNVEFNGAKGAYIGYYQDGDDANGWVNIGYLDNSSDIAWKNCVGNLTGNTSGANSIVWFAPELYALGAWTDGTDRWVTLSNSFGGTDWTLVGCGDFDGDGKESVLMSCDGGRIFYSADLNGSTVQMGSLNWSGWGVRAIGDFAGDGKDDVVLFHQDTGSMVMLANGNADDYASIGQLDPSDWFVAGCGDYNGDGSDDLLVRQYSTGMLGYYSNGDQARWNVLGYGVDMSWTVIA